LIEQAMVFALGFLIAGLLALAIAPAFWRRAIRLSRRRLELLVPLSTREIVAERDLLRAEFAVERSKLERKAAGLNEIHATEMAELGRRAVQLAEIGGAFTSLEKRHAEQSAELSAIRDRLARTEAEFAAINSAFYAATGLIERKDADLMKLRGELAEARAQSAKQDAAALADFQAQVAMRQTHLASARDDIARLRYELVSLGLERDADTATLRTTAERLADREEALKIAGDREIELQRRRKRNIAASRSIERRLLEKIGQISAEAASLRQDLAAARARADRLAQEGVRRLGAAPALAAQEENAILRQNINEIGAAIIRMAAFALEPAPEDERGNGEAPPRALSNVAATSK
jgi:predicted  nucleic acid-binding Zn-ribbon protein